MFCQSYKLLDNSDTLDIIDTMNYYRPYKKGDWKYYLLFYGVYVPSMFCLMSLIDKI